MIPRLRTILAVCLCAAVVTPSAWSGSEGSGESTVTPEHCLVRASEVAQLGLAYLATQQNEDHSFSIERGERDITRAPLAVTALVSLAFMAGGSTMGRGPFRDHVRDAIEYLIDHRIEKVFTIDTAGIQRERVAHYFHVESDSTSNMHGHGYATLALAQAYGTLQIDPTYRDSAAAKARDDQRRMREALTSAVRLIEWSQGSTGGWYYEPYDFRNDRHEGSVTITMIQALRAARNVGIDVDISVIDRAVDYVHKSQRPKDGAFRYQHDSPQVSFALTAAAIATLNASGDYDSDVIDLGIDYMRRHDPLINQDLRWSGSNTFPYYARLYAAQAYYVYRDVRIWEQWRELIVDDMENQQAATGAIGSSEYGKVYSTAVSCLVLQLPQQYLPIFQK